MHDRTRTLLIVLGCTALAGAIVVVTFLQRDRGVVDATALNAASAAEDAQLRSSRTAVDATEIPVVFIGDSYTHGTGSSSNGTRWTSLVAAAEGWTEINLGRGGTGYKTTSSQKGCGLTYCPNYDEMVPEALAASPAVVVVAGGANDFHSSLADVEPFIAKTFTDLRAALPAATIIAVGPSVIGAVNPAVVSFDAAVQHAATAVGARYVSLTNPDVLLPAMETADGGGHVTDVGHAAIAAAVIAGLK